MSRATDSDSSTPPATALDDALGGCDPSTGIDAEVSRAQTRRAAEYLAATGDRLGRLDLIAALADGSTLNRANWWGRAVDPGLRRLAEKGIVEYHPLDHTYRWDL
jgi:hypothetical protein